ncbi:FemAB family XrtA/PEP-CTERM system-associated protein [Alteromonas ponticola]|uniref:FemAB family PEP-CTERM system-associated protein n=1 Tax=Alteromonas ponticola TaxID=2720613 RepID=A0ABX1R1B9_9ALTE|nr:FemAB family XrtA/PEP-CTERM system-associated protein [Alteromonas ponticola]NMH59068.1 FemAB family PEP-CTERM system-associated protein [Alteromonas ponticola]
MIKDVVKNTDVELDELKSIIKNLKNEKGQTARQFKDVEAGSDSHQALVETMQGVTEQLKEYEALLKSRLKANKPAKKARPSSPALPAQFIQKEVVYTDEISVKKMVSEQEKDQWWQYVTQSKHASLYHSKAIYQFYCTQPHVQYEIFGAWSQSGELIGGMPVIRMSTPLFGQFAVSLPFFNYGGPLTACKRVFTALIEAYDQHARSAGDKYAEIRTTLKIDRQASEKKVSMLRALPANLAAFEKQLGAKVRAQAKKADEFSPEFKVGGEALLNDFYHVFSTNMRDLGTPVEHKSFFRSLLSVLGKQAKIAVVYVGNKPVGAAFLTTHKNMMEIPWASTLRSANKMNINMWMYDHILKLAITENYTWFDFGRSTKDAGTYRFKKQWGAVPVQHYWYTLATEQNTEQSLNPDNPKFKIAIAAWQRMPVWLANKIGPFIASQLP